MLSFHCSRSRCRCRSRGERWKRSTRRLRKLQVRSDTRANRHYIFVRFIIWLRFSRYVYDVLMFAHNQNNHSCSRGECRLFRTRGAALRVVGAQGGDNGADCGRYRSVPTQLRRSRLLQSQRLADHVNRLSPERDLRG